MIPLRSPLIRKLILTLEHVPFPRPIRISIKVGIMTLIKNKLLLSLFALLLCACSTPKKETKQDTLSHETLDTFIHKYTFHINQNSKYKKYQLIYYEMENEKTGFVEKSNHSFPIKENSHFLVFPTDDHLHIIVSEKGAGQTYKLIRQKKIDSSFGIGEAVQLKEGDIPILVDVEHMSSIQSDVTKNWKTFKGRGKILVLRLSS